MGHLDVISLTFSIRGVHLRLVMAKPWGSIKKNRMPAKNHKDEASFDCIIICNCEIATNTRRWTLQFI